MNNYVKILLLMNIVAVTQLSAALQNKEDILAAGLAQVDPVKIEYALQEQADPFMGHYYTHTPYVSPYTILLEKLQGNVKSYLMLRYHPDMGEFPEKFKHCLELLLQHGILVDQVYATFEVPLRQWLQAAKQKYQKSIQRLKAEMNSAKVDEDLLDYLNRNIAILALIEDSLFLINTYQPKSAIMPSHMHYIGYNSYREYLKHNNYEKPQPVRLKKICVTDKSSTTKSQERLLVVYDAVDKVIAVLRYDRDVHTFSEFEAELGQYFDLSNLSQESIQSFKK